MKAIMYSELDKKPVNKLSVGHRGLFWGGLILGLIVMAWPTA